MSSTSDKESSIHSIVEADDLVGLAQLLSRQPLLAKTRNHFHQTPLHLARSPATAHLLLASGADVNDPGWKEATPLHMAVQNGYDEVANVLLEAGADPNARTDLGFTPLHFARSSQVVQLLLSFGANMHAQALSGAKPIHSIAAGGHLNALQALVHNGVDVNDQSMGDGSSPLHEAVLRSHPEIVKFLLEHQANPVARNRRGETPVHLARFTQQDNILSLLEAQNTPVFLRLISAAEQFWAQRLRPHPTRQEAIVTGKDAKVARWDLTGLPQCNKAVQIDTAHIWDFAVSANGELVALASGENTVHLLDWDELRLIRTFDLPPQTRGARAITFSPNGRWLAVAGLTNEVVYILEVETGRPVTHLEGGEDTLTLAFAPSSSLLVSGCSFGGGALVALDQLTASGQIVKRSVIERTSGNIPSNRFVDTITHLSLSPDGSMLAILETGPIGAVLSGDAWYGNLVLYDMNSQAIQWVTPIDAYLVNTLATSPTTIKRNPTEIAFHPPHEIVCGAPGGLVLSFNVRDGTLLRQTVLTPSASVVSLAYHPRAHALYAVLETGEITSIPNF